MLVVQERIHTPCVIRNFKLIWIDSMTVRTLQLIVEGNGLHYVSSLRVLLTDRTFLRGIGGLCVGELMLEDLI
jgi:hypothetical protein